MMRKNEWEETGTWNTDHLGPIQAIQLKASVDLPFVLYQIKRLKDLEKLKQPVAVTGSLNEML